MAWFHALMLVEHAWNATPLWNFPPGAVYFQDFGWDRQGDGGFVVRVQFWAIDDDSVLLARPGHDFSDAIPEDATWEREGVAA